jgi:hypothetical protein
MGVRMTDKTVDEMIHEYNERVNRAVKTKVAKFLRELAESEKKKSKSK